MIKFHVVRWRNLLSTGNAFTEIQLDRSPSTLIVGRNGGGKSSAIDAIVFALYGKPFRNINKAQLINSINKKDAEVQLEFSIGTKHYRIIRGIKPNKFEIYIDGELIPQDAASKDYQAYLEENILKLNYKSFTQSSILASAQYIPFMQLPAGSRREVIEDLLDITVFSKMNDVLKERISLHKNEVIELERSLDVAKMKLESQNQHIEYVEKTNLERKEKINLDIKKLDDDIGSFEVSREEYIKSIDEIDYSPVDALKEKLSKKERKAEKLQEAKSEAENRKFQLSMELVQPFQNDEIDSLQKDISITEGKISESKTSIKYLNDLKGQLTKELLKPIQSEEIDNILITIQKNEVEKVKVEKEVDQLLFRLKDIQNLNVRIDNEFCPTCTQPISEEFKASKREEHEKETNVINSRVDELRTAIEALDKANNDLHKQQETIKATHKVKLEEELAEIDSKLEGQQLEIGEGEYLIKHLNTKITSIKDVHNKSKKQLLGELEEVVKTIDNDLHEVSSSIKQLTKQIAETQASLDEKKNELENSIKTTTWKIESTLKRIKELSKELDEIENKKDLINEEIAKRTQLEEYLHNIESQSNEKHIERKYLDMAVTIMKDNGIKTSIIKKYIPIINKMINSYLQIMDLFVEYELDETFNESMKARHRDEFSYASFSEGEKARIDLAILFTFRAIAKMKSTSSTSLLLLDETFDGSIDSEGSDSISAILKTLEDTNVFCISHNEKMFDNFRNIIQFGKVNNFSVII